MFALLGRGVRWAWPALLILWVLLLLGTWLASPPWSEVAQDKEFEFLPQSAPSRQAEAEYARAFPENKLTSSIVLLVYHNGKQPEALARDNKFISEDLYPRLRQIADEEGGLASEPAPSEGSLFGEDTAKPPPTAKRSIIAHINTPNTPGAGVFLVSPDGQAQLVVLELVTDLLSHANWPIINKVEKVIEDLKNEHKVPAGTNLAMTGSAVIGRDHSVAEVESVRATGLLTVLLVIGLLIVIYRAPLLAAIPLVTVFLSVEVALHVLAWLGGHGYLDLFQGLQIYITILAYGAGVDYCLFLTARYKEELDKGASPAEAVERAIGGVGAALAASAATVICGIAMMRFAQFGKFQVAGIAIPLTLLFVLLATLTFSPSLLRLAGYWAFWPHLRRAAGGKTTVHGHGMGGWFQQGELRRIWDHVGQMLLRRAGRVWLIAVACMLPLMIIGGLLYDRVSYDLIEELPAKAPSVKATHLLEQHFSAGMIGAVTVLLVDPQVDFSTPEGREVIQKVTETVASRKEALRVADVRSLTAPLGITPASQTNPLEGLHLAKVIEKEAKEKGSFERYVTAMGERKYIGTRLEIILAENPFARQSINDLERIRQVITAAIPANLRAQARVYLAGTTASVRDLAAVMQSDRLQINILVVASVTVILLVLLRQVLVTIYLLLSVLFSYYVTLGVTFIVFWLIEPSGFAGLDWKVPVFLFTILIAVGEDYNIFLMARIHEEDRQFGPIRGITEALDRTGPIISSCGIIMAGTFATLLAGSLSEMKQLGFALAFGVLLDTFVVRPILVPAFLVLLRQGRVPLLSWAAANPATPAPAAAEPQRSTSGAV
jgi:RND superfamily putative drug exporter